MRKSPTLDALFTVPRQGILAATLMEPRRWWYLSDLARHLGVHHATLQRDLARLTGAGILLKRRDGNRVYYRANSESPIFAELSALLMKTAGLVDVLKDALRPFERIIHLAFVYGSFAGSTEVSESDIDFMILGDVTLRDLAPVLPRLERTLSRPVNPSIYRPAEFVEKASSENHFIRDVLRSKKLFIIGNQDDLDKLAQGRASAKTLARQARNRRTTTGG